MNLNPDYEDTELGLDCDQRILRNTRQLDREIKRAEEVRRYREALQARDYEIQQFGERSYSFGAWLFAIVGVLCLVGGIIIFIAYGALK